MAKQLKPDSLIMVTVLVVIGAVWWGLTRGNNGG